MRPRIAILTNYPSDESMLTGGVESATEALLEGLAPHQEEFEFHVVALDRRQKERIVQSRRGFLFHFLPVPLSIWKRPRTLFNIATAVQELRSLHADLVHCQDNMALAVAAIAAGQADLFTIHGVKKDEARKWMGQEYWSHQMDGWLERYVHRRFKAFVAISNYAASVLGKEKRVFPIPNAVSRRWFKDARPARDSARRIVCVGAYNRLKRQDWLLKAMMELQAELEEYEVVLCGNVDDPKYFAELSETVSRRQLRKVSLMQKVPRDNFVRLLSSSTILLHPSAQENSPMVIAEAMAAGIPVVAARVGGIPEMLEDRTEGLLFDQDDFDGFLRQLRRVLTDESLRVRLSTRAAQCARERFCPESVATRTVAVYRILLDERSQTGKER